MNQINELREIASQRAETVYETPTKRIWDDKNLVYIYVEGSEPKNAEVIEPKKEEKNPDSLLDLYMKFKIEEERQKDLNSPVKKNFQDVIMNPQIAKDVVERHVEQNVPVYEEPLRITARMEEPQPVVEVRLMPEVKIKPKITRKKKKLVQRKARRNVKIVKIVHVRAKARRAKKKISRKTKVKIGNVGRRAKSSTTSLILVKKYPVLKSMIEVLNMKELRKIIRKKDLKIINKYEDEKKTLYFVEGYYHRVDKV